MRADWVLPIFIRQSRCVIWCEFDKLFNIEWPMVKKDWKPKKTFVLCDPNKSLIAFVAFHFVMANWNWLGISNTRKEKLKNIWLVGCIFPQFVVYKSKWDSKTYVIFSFCLMPVQRGKRETEETKTEKMKLF